MGSLCRKTLAGLGNVLGGMRAAGGCDREMPSIEVTVPGVEKLLRDLNPHKAAGPDQISPAILKNLSHQIAPILQNIFNKSLATGELPEIWKQANVSPIYKKGPRSDPANYRPISLTCICCKILEHIIASNVMKFFNSNNLLYDLQHGFREKRSCQSQLLMLVEDLHRAINAKQQTDLILLDFSKAFDKVNHEKLLLKLFNYGVRGHTLNWIRGFLNNRGQSVVINGVKSNNVPVCSGVPQGSVLGPILFLIYINDLPVGLKSKTRLFADDTAVYLSFTTQKSSAILQRDLDMLQEWERAWDMHFNPSKCQVIHITKRRTPLNTSYTLHNTTLEAVTSAKYLGVTISDDLSWHKHINSMTQKANKTLGFLRRNLKVTSENLKSTAYKTLVRPQLEYCSPIWSPHTTTCISQIEMVQRRAARWIKHDYARTSSVSDMLTSLGLRRLDFRRIDQRLILFYNIVHNRIAIPPENYLAPNTRPTRSTNDMIFKQIPAYADAYKYSFFPDTIVRWNSLNGCIVSLPPEAFSRAVAEIEHTPL